MDRITMTIEGMTCGHCVSQVTKALERIEGVQVEQVKMGAATVAYDPASTSEAQIEQAVEGQGYAVVATTR